MLDNLERKFGKYAIKNLIVYILCGYLIGYLLELGQLLTGVNYINYLTLNPMYIIHGFQIWRLVTWVVVPPSTSNVIWLLLMVFCYYQFGTMLERMWGAFKFNLYIFGGMLFTVIGAFISYGLCIVFYGDNLLSFMTQIAVSYATVSTYYINLSIFLAIAMSMPDAQVLLYFIIPIKMKWMAILYIAFVSYDIIKYTTAGYFPAAVTIAMSLFNFVVFMLLNRKKGQPSRAARQRSQAFHRAADPVKPMRDGKVIARHKCAVCGRTEVSNPQLEFRFCSKCHGNYEYCSDHLFTHVHIQ